MIEEIIPFDGVVDVPRTLKVMELWGASPWLRVEGEVAWFAQREASGVATVELSAVPGGVRARGYGAGAEELLARVPSLLGLERPGLARVEPHHDVVREVQKRLPGLRVGRSGLVYPGLVATALAQKVTGPNGKMALHRIVRAWGERAPGPRDDVWLLPEPKVLARQPYYTFHPMNVERRRAELLIRIATRAGALQRAASMDLDAGRVHLEKLPGIGPWTSGVVMGGPLGDADAVPLGDYHLPGIVGFALAGEREADDGRMMELLEPYAGLRGVVARALKVGTPGPPRRGPRLEVRDIRGH